MGLKGTTLQQLTKIFNVFQVRFPVKEINPPLFYLPPRNTDRPKVMQIEVIDDPNPGARSPGLIWVQLQANEAHSSDKINGFTDRLLKVLPSLYGHNCAITNSVGFVAGLREGVHMSHVIGHIAHELQVLAGMECVYNCGCNSALRGENTVAFPYINERAGKYAAVAAVRFAGAIMYDESYDIEEDIVNLKKLKQKMIN